VELLRSSTASIAARALERAHPPGTIITGPADNVIRRCSQDSHAIAFAQNADSELDKTSVTALHEKCEHRDQPAAEERESAGGIARCGGRMEIPQGLKYSKEHEWVATEESIATVGITDHAQDQLGEIVYIELPAVGDKVSKDDPFGVVESVKAVSDIYAPISGTVVEVNEDLPESPEVVNEDPYGDGWLIKVKMNDPTDLDDLMDHEEYAELVAREKE
jgi:glycine cleavage system H protein